MADAFGIDGHNSAATICADIAVIIKAYVKLILALDVNVSGDLGPLVGEIVATLVAILNVSLPVSSSPPFLDTHPSFQLGYHRRMRQVLPHHDRPPARRHPRRRPRRACQRMLPLLPRPPRLPHHRVRIPLISLVFIE